MPGAAFRMGGAEQVLPLSAVAEGLLALCVGTPAREKA
jgi:hypothetical protein